MLWPPVATGVGDCGGSQGGELNVLPGHYLLDYHDRHVDRRFLMFVVGVVLITTVVGAVIGTPIFLAALALFQNRTTLRGTPCFP